MRNKSTFVASVRGDIRDIAIIGRYMTAHGYVLESRGIIASQAIKMLADIIRDDQPRGTVLEAIEILAEINCRSGKHDKAKKALALQILESQREDETSKQIREFNLKQTDKRNRTDKIGKDYFNTPDADGEEI